MEYLTNQHFNRDQLYALYKSVGWTAYIQDLTALELAVKNSLWFLGAYDKQQLVGLIRIVGDGATIIYIQDLLVKPYYQKQGIGSHLVKSTVDKFRSVRQKVLLTIDVPPTRSFYEHCGFTACDQGSLVAFYREY